MTTKLDLDSIFTYHAPHGSQVDRYALLRTHAREFAGMIAQLAPESTEQTLAIRKVQEAVMFANAAIAINEPAP